MKRLFAALVFFEDANLSDRAYWYLCPFPTVAGAEVFAPVGTRNRLQRARVLQTVSAEGGDAPYPPGLCKRVAAPCGDRKRTAGDFTAYELGGVRYDEKRYTAFGRVLIAQEIPQTLSVLRELGAATLIRAEHGAAAALRELLHAEGCALLCGKDAREAARILLALARGGESGLFADGTGWSGEELSALSEILY